MKKNFWLISTAVVFVAGFIIHCSYRWSEASAWSILISSVNLSAWELYKPFALIYISFIIIELSYLRPSLLHYICAKILSLHIFTILMLAVGTIYLMLFCRNGFSEFYFIIIFLVLAVSEYIGNLLYNSSVKFELFYVPIILSLLIICFMLLIFSLYPPHNAVFYDFFDMDYGPYNYNFVENNFRI